MRILAVDPGEKHLGLAMSDPTGTIASPLMVLKHISRTLDAASIANLALENQVGLIVVGKSLDDDGADTTQSRLADRLVAAIQKQCNLPVITWDESFSTSEARQAMLQMNTTRQKRRGHMDDMAAVVILQSYMDAMAEN